MKRAYSKMMFTILIGVVALASAPFSLATSKVKYHAFKGLSDGAYPSSRLVEDAPGNFYGSTANGGETSGTCPDHDGCGTVFKLSSNGSGTWTKAIIYKFTGAADGKYPQDLTLDALGNIYGLAGGGSLPYGYGLVFELSSTQGGSWSEKTLYAFQNGPDGGVPSSAVIFDAAGSLYGTALGGGSCSQGQCGGVVFKLTPKQNGTWAESVLYDFPLDPDGVGPRPGPIVFGNDGNLYGTTEQGGAHSSGSVFELIANSNGTWTEQDLYQFESGLDGGVVSSGVIFDNAGNLYGETAYGGSLACPFNGCGVIFKLAPNGDGLWTESTAYTFDGLNGSRGENPSGGLTLDSEGNMYGATLVGGTNTCGQIGFSCGTVFELSPAAPTGTFRVLGSFNGVNGGEPATGVVLDSSGNIFGSASLGGDFNCYLSNGNGCGTVFEITP